MFAPDLGRGRREVEVGFTGDCCLVTVLVEVVEVVVAVEVVDVADVVRRGLVVEGGGGWEGDEDVLASSVLER